MMAILRVNSVLGPVYKQLEKDWRNWKSGEESIPCRYQHFKNRTDHSEEFLKPKKTCCHSDANER